MVLEMYLQKCLFAICGKLSSAEFCSFQNKENRGLMERLTSLANAHAQGLDRVQFLEVELSKAASEKLSVEEKEKKSKEETNQV